MSTSETVPPSLLTSMESTSLSPPSLPQIDADNNFTKLSHAYSLSDNITKHNKLIEIGKEHSEPTIAELHTHVVHVNNAHNNTVNKIYKTRTNNALQDEKRSISKVNNNNIFVAVRVRPMHIPHTQTDTSSNFNRSNDNYCNNINRQKQNNNNNKYMQTINSEKSLRLPQVASSLSLSSSSSSSSSFSSSSLSNSPSSEEEEQKSLQRCVHVLPNNVIECNAQSNKNESESVIVNNNNINNINNNNTTSSSNGSLSYRFASACDVVFDEHASQEEIMTRVGLPAVDRVMEGYNGTILCYGQSGSGKTYTMIGPNGGNEDALRVQHEHCKDSNYYNSNNNNNNNNNNNLYTSGEQQYGCNTNVEDECTASTNSGLLTRILIHLLAQLRKEELAGHSKAWSLTLSAVELYKEELRDLLPIPIVQRALAKHKRRQQASQSSQRHDRMSDGKRNNNNMNMSDNKMRYTNNGYKLWQSSNDQRETRGDMDGDFYNRQSSPEPEKEEIPNSLASCHQIESFTNSIANSGLEMSLSTLDRTERMMFGDYTASPTTASNTNSNSHNGRMATGNGSTTSTDKNNYDRQGHMTNTNTLEHKNTSFSIQDCKVNNNTKSTSNNKRDDNNVNSQVNNNNNNNNNSNNNNSHDDYVKRKSTLQQYSTSLPPTREPFASANYNKTNATRNQSALPTSAKNKISRPGSKRGEQSKRSISREESTSSFATVNTFSPPQGNKFAVHGNKQISPKLNALTIRTMKKDNVYHNFSMSNNKNMKRQNTNDKSNSKSRSNGRSVNNVSLITHTSSGVYVQGLSKHSIRNIDDALDLLHVALHERHMGVTQLNVNSNRAHTLFFVEVEQIVKKDELNKCYGSNATNNGEMEEDDDDDAALLQESTTTNNNVVLSHNEDVIRKEHSISLPNQEKKEPLLPEYHNNNNNENVNIKLAINDNNVPELDKRQNKRKQHQHFTAPQKSHALLSSELASTTVKKSLLTLVDLAGSERVSHTGAEGTRLKEAQKINCSLMLLANVIRRLNTINKNMPASSLSCPTHIPYRDSKLTWLLRDSFGGNTITFVLCNISPHIQNARETISTLRFATSMKLVFNIPVINTMEAHLSSRAVTALQRRLREAQNYIQLLESQLKAQDEDNNNHNSSNGNNTHVHTTNTAETDHSNNTKNVHNAPKQSAKITMEKKQQRESAASNEVEKCNTKVDNNSNSNNNDDNNTMTLHLEEELQSVKEAHHQTTHELLSVKEEMTRLMSSLAARERELQELKLKSSESSVENSPLISTIPNASSSSSSSLLYLRQLNSNNNNNSNIHSNNNNKYRSNSNSDSNALPPYPSSSQMPPIATSTTNTAEGGMTTMTTMSPSSSLISFACAPNSLSSCTNNATTHSTSMLPSTTESNYLPRRYSRGVIPIIYRRPSFISVRSSHPSNNSNINNNSNNNNNNCSPNTSLEGSYKYIPVFAPIHSRQCTPELSHSISLSPMRSSTFNNYSNHNNSNNNANSINDNHNNDKDSKVSRAIIINANEDALKLHNKHNDPINDVTDHDEQLALANNSVKQKSNSAHSESTSDEDGIHDNFEEVKLLHVRPGSSDARSRLWQRWMQGVQLAVAVVSNDTK